jgi:Flp pilus assembly pilin Flp
VTHLQAGALVVEVGVLAFAAAVTLIAGWVRR